MNPSAFPHLTVPPGDQGVVVVTRALRALLAGTGSGFRLLTIGMATSSGRADDNPRVDTTDSVVVTTSGSTGTPRGVILPIRALLESADLGAAALGPPGPWLTAVPVTGVGGLLTVLRTLRADAVPVAWPGLAGAGSFTPESFMAVADPFLEKAAAEGRTAYLSLVPTQVLRLLSSARAGDLAARFTSILVGGSAVAPGIRAQAEHRGLNLVQTYGATETCGGVVFDGVPLPGVTVDIVDGLIRIGGPTMATGYLDGHDERFAGGQFHTSDLGTWQDGHLEILGRNDHVIKVGGEKVSLDAINRVVLADPRVLDAATLSDESAEWGQVAHVLVVPREPEHSGLAAALTESVVAALGRHYRPHTMTVVTEIPVSDSGKPRLQRER